MLNLKTSRTLTSLLALTALVGVTAQTVAPRPANAFVAAVVVYPLVPALGVAMAITLGGGGLAGGFYGMFRPNQSPYHSNEGDAWEMLTLLGFVSGAIFLDNHGASYEYKDLTDEQARSLGLTDAEAQAYRDHLPEINSINEQMARSLTANPKQKPEALRREWGSLAEELDADTVRAVEKVSMHAYQKAAQSHQARK